MKLEYDLIYECETERNYKISFARETLYQRQKVSYKIIKKIDKVLQVQNISVVWSMITKCRTVFAVASFR